MAKTKYKGVYTDSKGQFYYETELGVDRITGKRIRKKSRKNANGKTFASASDANKELTRIKREYHKANGYANYRMTYQEFLDTVYIPYYRTEVEESTFEVRENIVNKLRERFGSFVLREITIEDVQNFRTWLLTHCEHGGAGFSQAYASMIFGVFRKTLDKAVEMQYLEYNISMKVKAIPKGKANVAYWTKTEFEKVINQIYIGDFYEHLCFVMLWVYYMTGVRVNEGMALWWENIDFKKKRMQVHHMLILKNKSDWKRNSYTKTEDGLRTIAIDDDTISILKEWKHRQKTIGLGKENDFVFSYDGLPMIKCTLARIIARYASLANVKKVQGKGLRHSHASYLINEFNISVVVLCERMGHSSPEITLKHYSHMWSGADITIVEQMSGNIKIRTAEQKLFEFTENQVIKSSSPPNSPPNPHFKTENTVVSRE